MWVLLILTVPSGPGDLPFLLLDPLNRLIGESFGFHSPAVVESHRIECEVELIRKIKGDLLRALGFNYSLILTEDTSSNSWITVSGFSRS